MEPLDRPRRRFTAGRCCFLLLLLACSASSVLFISLPTLDRMALERSDLAALRSTAVAAMGDPSLHGSYRRDDPGWSRLPAPLQRLGESVHISSDRVVSGSGGGMRGWGVEIVAPGVDTRDLDPPQRPGAGSLHTKLAPGVYFWRSNT